MTPIRGRTIHQLIVGAVPGDAIADQAFLIRSWLRAAGAHSEIYAERIHPKLEREVRPYHDCRIEVGRGDRLLFHYSIGSDLSQFVRPLPGPVMMIYHNITPASFFQGADSEALAATERGRSELGSFPNVALAVANSEYSRRELVAAGYAPTGVLPLAVDGRRSGLDPDPEVLRRFGDGRTNLLFVGRIAPNKRQQDIIAAFRYYRSIDPTARLILVGGPFTASFQTWIERFARSLGVADSVVFAGHVSDAELIAYYRIARVFVCLSEHEGFGLPLIEAMRSGVPVLAYASSAIPDTLGDAGVLVHEKSYPILAELIHLLAQDGPFRSQLIATGRARAARFAPEVVRAIFERHLQHVL